MKKNTFGTVSAVIVACLFPLLSGAQYSPVANLTEKWTNDANWKLSADSGVTNVFTGDSLGIKFKARTGDVSQDLKYGEVNADGTASLPAGRFTGNYVNSEISSVEFDVMRLGMITNVMLSVSSSNDHVWYRPFALSAATSVWEHISIPLVFSNNWARLGPKTQEIFDQDISAVSKIGVWAASTNSTEQVLMLDNFKVVGPWELGPMTADHLPEFWLQEYEIVGATATGDSDDDGLSNLGEYLLEFNPKDPLSKFMVAIRRDQAGRKVLNWKHVKNREFEILASGDLRDSGSFTNISPVAIASSGPTNEVILDEVAGEAVFYKVGLKLP
jgi:hypothetical protein